MEATVALVAKKHGQLVIRKVANGARVVLGWAKLGWHWGIRCLDLQVAGGAVPSVLCDGGPAAADEEEHTAVTDLHDTKDSVNRSHGEACGLE